MKTILGIIGFVVIWIAVANFLNNLIKKIGGDK
jgi:hypothetical protein